jgi:hypothetical protein
MKFAALRLSFATVALSSVICLLGCGGSATTTTSSNFLYATGSNAFDQYAFQVNSDGTLAAVPGPTTLATIGHPIAIFPDASGTFLYSWQEPADNDDTGVESPAGLSVYRIDKSTGALTLAGTPVEVDETRIPLQMFFASNGTVYTDEGAALGFFRQDATTGAQQEASGSPFPVSGKIVTLSPEANRLVTITNGSSLSVYSIDAATGAPTLATTAPMTSSYSGGAVLANNAHTFVMPIQEAGTTPTLFLRAFTILPDDTLSAGGSASLPEASRLVFSPDNRFIYAVSGSHVAAFNATGTGFTPIGQAVTYAPIGPTVALPVVDATGKWLYVSEWFDLLAFPIDATTGAVGTGTVMADTPDGSSSLAAVAPK